MEQYTSTPSVLTIDQYQCLLQIWEKLTYTLVFSGQERTLYQAMRGAYSVLNSDQATVDNARNQLVRNFANLSIAEIKQLTLNCLATTISGCDQSFGTSVGGRLASTLRTTSSVSESAPLSNPAAAVQVDDANRDWDVKNILGKKIVDGELQYLVDWCPTMVPEHELGNAKELVDEFEARVRIAVADTPRNRRRGI